MVQVTKMVSMPHRSRNLVSGVLIRLRRKWASMLVGLTVVPLDPRLLMTPLEWMRATGSPVAGSWPIQNSKASQFDGQREERTLKTMS